MTNGDQARGLPDTHANLAVPFLDIDKIIGDRDTKIIICCGSGGVGKTTTSAAIALRAAEAGRKVVVLTIDPARRLAQSLGVGELDNTPRPVPMGSSVTAALACSLLFMSGNRGTMTSIVKGLLGVGAVGAGCLAYAGLYEVNAFRLRRVTVPVLPTGSRDIRVLHDGLHMTSRPAPLRCSRLAGSR